MPRTVPRPLVWLCALALLGAACSDDDAGRGTTSTTAGPTSTSTTTAAASCPEQDPAPGEAVADPWAADVDGDGDDDDVVVTVVDDRSIAVEVRFAAGARTVSVYDDDSVATFAPVRVARVADVDADGDDDLWLVVGAGAAVEVVSLVLGDGCDLVRPDGDGGPNTATVGASVGFLSGVECADVDDDGTRRGFFEHTAERTEGSTYHGRSTAWVVETDPPGLRREAQTSFTVDLEREDGARYTGLTCRPG